MSDIVIAVENLSKRYLVGHRSAERERYTALRDVIAREARNFAPQGARFRPRPADRAGRRGRGILGAART